MTTTTIDLSSLTEDGDTLDLGDGRTLRLRIRPDEDIDPFKEFDCYGKLSECRTDGQRPAGFDGNAEKLRLQHDCYWWQPPADGPKRGTDEFASLRQSVIDVANDGLYGVVLELLSGKDGYGQPIVAKVESLWAIDGLRQNDYLSTVVRDLADEMGLAGVSNQ